jgi:hypothetical protein|tara:strand:+ start:982 stop:1233 length:252 start_codon:yes stop_codon:yes gene_type:complete
MIVRILGGLFLLFCGYSCMYPLLFDGISLGDPILETTKYRGEILREEVRYYENWDLIKDIFSFIIGIPFLYIGLIVIFKNPDS